MGRKSQEHVVSQSPRCLTRSTRFAALTYHELARRLRERIGQHHRYAHSVRVARCAEVLAMRHGLVARKARIAGLLHDLARLYSPRQLLDECAARGLTTDDLERASPILLHARLGAELAREDFGVTDPEVLSAIAKHTHGDGAMSALDCVVYLADSLEPERHFPERAGLWKLAQRDLPAAMHGTLASMILYLEGRGLAPAPQAIAALRSFERAATQKETERCRS